MLRNCSEDNTAVFETGERADEIGVDDSWLKCESMSECKGPLRH